MLEWQKIFDGSLERSLKAGATLFRREDPVEFMYLVRSGQIALERPMTDGSALTLHIASKGMALAEASLFANAYRQPAIVVYLPKAAFLAELQKSPKAALGLIETSAREVQAQRARIEILRFRRVSDRLDAWLDLFGEPAKGGWVRVADGIGVSQPALYREIAQRRQ
jgi:CRP-like cAMP-binding protein